MESMEEMLSQEWIPEQHIHLAQEENSHLNHKESK
jgi:hypothetical protein